MTEIGRRTAILAGTFALTINVVVGGLTGGDMRLAVIMGVASALVFGFGGLLIGNLIESYIYRAAQRELAQRLLERELAAEQAEQELNEEEVGMETEEAPVESAV